MVEVPLEIDAELPREFDGAALLASSGLPRKVKIKANKDALKLSTAYRTDQLIADIVKVALRATPPDVQRVQDAVTRFIRAVRERRQEGATLQITSNGRGKIEVLEQMPPGRAEPVSADRLASVERRIGELEAALSKANAAADLGERMAQLEERFSALTQQLARTVLTSEVAGPLMGKPAAQALERTPGGPRRVTAVDAFADGLRKELRERAAAALLRARPEMERSEKIAALAAEAELLGAPNDGTADRLRDADGLVAARETALEKLVEEIEFYAPADLPVAEKLLARLEDGPSAPDAPSALEPVAQALVRAAKGKDCTSRTAWLKRAAALCGWQLVEPSPGEPLQEEWHVAIDSGGAQIVRIASPGLKRADGSKLVEARVLVDPAAISMEIEAEEAAAPAPEAELRADPPTERISLALAAEVAAAVESHFEITDEDVEESHDLESEAAAEKK